MRYSVVIKATNEGFSAWVPGLPGCWSEGKTQAEALENIRDAISEYLSVAQSVATREQGATAHQVDVA